MAILNRQESKAVKPRRRSAVRKRAGQVKNVIFSFHESGNSSPEVAEPSTISLERIQCRLEQSEDEALGEHRDDAGHQDRGHAHRHERDDNGGRSVGGRLLIEKR